MNIHGKKILMRAPELRDAALLHQWANDPEIWKQLGDWHFPYSSISTEKWIYSLSESSSDRVFCIDTFDGQLLGTANLVDIDWKNRNAFHGMMLGKVDARGKGLGLDAVMSIMRYAFDELGLMRLDGDMIETNIRSINFYVKSCGWEIEGRKKQWFYRGGQHYDKVLVGITREKYHLFVDEINYWE